MVIPGVFVRAELSCYLIVQVNVCFGAWTLSNNDVPVTATTQCYVPNYPKLISRQHSRECRARSWYACLVSPKGPYSAASIGSPHKWFISVLASCHCWSMASNNGKVTTPLLDIISQEALASSLGRLGWWHETLATATPNPALLAAPPQKLVTGTTHTARPLFWCALQ
jgi:hypothetical protein